MNRRGFLQTAAGIAGAAGLAIAGLPAGAPAVTAAVDVQQERLMCHCVGAEVQPEGLLWWKITYHFHIAKHSGFDGNQKSILCMGKPICEHSATVIEPNPNLDYIGLIQKQVGSVRPLLDVTAELEAMDLRLREWRISQTPTQDDFDALMANIRSRQ